MCHLQHLASFKFKADITNIHRTGKISPRYDSVFSLVLSSFSGTVKYNLEGGGVTSIDWDTRCAIF